MIEAMSSQTAVAMISHGFEQFHDILFELVCETLGLSLQGTRFRRSLYLVIHLGGDNPAIGICRHLEPDLGSETRDEERPISRVTVCRDDILSVGIGGTLLEAVEVSQEGKDLPSYEWIGVWVPQYFTPWQDVSSLTDENMYYAVLI